MGSERYALILDDEHNSLGAVALRLLRLGIDTSYAKDRDEAFLWAQQEAERIRAILFPPSVDVGEVMTLATQISARSQAEPPNPIVIGQRPAEPQIDGLRKGGVLWALWEPYDESSLRWVVNEAMAPSDAGSTRQEPRVPTTFLGKTWYRTHRKDVVVSSLSIRGAYLETPNPFWEGIELTVEIPLPDGPLVTKATVRYQTEGRTSGMGVAFAPLDLEKEMRLQSYVEAHAGIFTL
ncbi:MAG: PilZ domain-containing protein [Deltaproteobacteria bacterium]|nr:MAG: PilZ domain-containing protein [Deltaproteobacteria bacterium]